MQLGASPTGAHVYKVWLNDCVMIVGSNTLSEQLPQTPKADADSIVANQVVVKVQRPLWEAAPARSAWAFRDGLCCATAPAPFLE